MKALSLVLILIGPSLPRKVTSVKKDASEIKFLPTELPEERQDAPRVSRQSSSLYTPSTNVKYQYHFVPVPAVQHSESDSENEEPSGNEPQYITQQVQSHYDIPQKTQEQILAAVIRATKQPKTPVYHATPLEPYGALLKEIPPAHKKAEEKTILVTPKPIIEHHESEDHSLGIQSGGHSYYTSAKITEALIQEPKHAPLVYHHQKLHHQPSLHHEEYEEPKSVSLLFNLY
ncbi:hypothetical protein C0J52_17125 [Blattella germanica]|nr:hypothetical protein C0J52_17125 [Blattella germanica]